MFLSEIRFINRLPKGRLIFHVSYNRVWSLDSILLEHFIGPHATVSKWRRFSFPATRDARIALHYTMRCNLLYPLQPRVNQTVT